MCAFALYPRIRLDVALGLADGLRGLSLDEIAKQVRFKHERQFYTATGGARIGVNELVELRKCVLAIADANGFPAKRRPVDSRAFDRCCALHLIENLSIAPGEAARDEMWSFLACVVLPDIVAWRFAPDTGAGAHVERYAGGVRNTFQRLWWRAFIFRGDSANEQGVELMDSLYEDELVQIMERPNLYGNRDVSRGMARALVRVASERKVARMTLMREGAKRMRRLSSTLTFDVMDRGVTEEFIYEVFLQASRHLEGDGDADIGAASGGDGTVAE